MLTVAVIKKVIIRLSEFVCLRNPHSEYITKGSQFLTVLTKSIRSVALLSSLIVSNTHPGETSLHTGLVLLNTAVARHLALLNKTDSLQHVLLSHCF